LARDPSLPPILVDPLRRFRPDRLGIAGDFPLLPPLAECLVERLPEGLKGLLPPLPDDINLGVVRDGLEGDVWHTLIDEALPDVPPGGLLGGHSAAEFRFLDLPLPRIGEEVVGVPGAHNPRSGKG